MRSAFLGKFEVLQVVKSAFSLLKENDLKKIKIIMIAQVLLGFLDLAGIALIGLVASLAISGINSKTPVGVVGQILEALNLSSISFQAQTAILSSFALCVFVSRTLLSLFFVQKTLFFIARCAAEIAADLFGKILSRSLTVISKSSSQQYVYSLTSGIEILTLRIMGGTITLVADLASLLLIVCVLVYVNLPMTLVATFVVGIMVWILHHLTSNESRRLGSRYSTADIASRESLLDSLNAFREISSKARILHFEDKFRSARHGISKDLAESTFMPYMSKYIIESSIITAAFIVAGTQFLLTDATNAVTTLSIFMASGTRLAPAVLRIQQGLLIINNSWGIASSTLLLINELKDVNYRPGSLAPKFSDLHKGFDARLELESINFKYPLAKGPTLKNISLEVQPGESIALVGPSGSGKTTLIDLMLGLLIPDSGSVFLSGTNPSKAISQWPGSIGYVPQDIYISNATVGENVALGFPIEEIDESKIWSALEQAQIASFISALDKGLATNLGDRGVKLSGGQKQRLGIARALLTKPRILFLDEATSALDSQTEHDVSEAINGLKGEVTLIFIAHRLSTAKRADRVIYISAGEILAQGSFDEVKRAVPDFQKQAELMDLG
jgi:ABC-type multidrug transport system fused ATPase/permease subunit